MNKFPKIVAKKWKRYNRIEKIFIVYLFFLLILEAFFPILKIEGITFSFINLKLINISIILVFTLLFVILRNISFTLKSIIKDIFGFYENEALINFGVLFLHISLLIFVKDIISLLAFTQSATFYQISWGYYILAFFLVFGLIWNLFMAVNNSLFQKKKHNYSKVVGLSENSQTEKKELKSLFE